VIGESVFVSGPLEIASQALAAILATWLGLTVLSRAPTERAPRVFGWVTFLLLAWSASILVERTTSGPQVARLFNATEDVAAFLLPAAGLHIVLAFTTEGRYPRWHSAALVTAYILVAVVALQHVLDPGRPIAISAPRFEPGIVSGEVLGWAFVGVRIAVFALAIGLAGRAYLAVRREPVRGGQTLAALATVSLASVGGTLRFLPRAIGGPNWVGVSFITLALVVASYAVFGQGIFLTQPAIRNAFRSSLLGGLAVAVYVGALGALEAVAEPALHTTLPIVMVLALVATVALLDPVRERLQLIIGRRPTPREAAYRRLGRALGIPGLADQPPEVAIQPAIDGLARRLGFLRAMVTSVAGADLALVGGGLPTTEASLTVPLESEGQTLGEARFGPRADGRPYSTRERALLDDAGRYFAASLRVGQLRTEQADALAALRAEQTALTQRGTDLHESLVASPDAGLRVFALGPMRVERGGNEIHGWGGLKAGSRQALAIFAFLFDRGDRGASKDEIIDVVWPDADLEHADLAFHRTLVGLRSTLEPNRPHRGASAAIAFHHDRYRLSHSLIAWSDVHAFHDLIAQAGEELDPHAALRLLEEARDLVRGDYLDDCPFYGDSEYVEERRRLLRGRFIDLLVTLGERYEAVDNRPAAGSAFRDALAAAGGECAPASDGLARLGVPA
jgi:DNA-binding SARP family transcriptional activator